MRQLWSALLETLRLFGADPFGMLAVVGARIFDDPDAAQARLNKVYEENR